MFFINKKEIKVNNMNLNLNTLSIKSSPYDYNVFFKQELIYSTISNIYKKGDILIIDKNIYNLIKNNITIPKEYIYICEALENLKTLDGVEKILCYLQKKNFTKGENLIAVGGGIIQDVCSFTSCIYKRGVNWKFIPTTLLSMCDSCIGSKSCLNYNSVKNQLGVFYAPKEIYININFLKTLSENDLKSGLGEILRLYSTGGEYYLNIYDKYVKNGKVLNFDNYTKLILTALTIKKSVIEIDQFETDIRKGLNYGHTFGHVLESISNYEIPHGIAVTIGMYITNKLYNKNFKLFDRLCLDLIKHIDLKKYNFDNLEKLMKKDKKIIGNKLVFVYLQEYGKLYFEKIVIDSKFVLKLKKLLCNM